ncbi:hypothetical protein N9537_07600 [Porticoccaceae bacterium]|nr:hypothetical protein [Porticoccaceae bacterium]
MNTKDLFEFHQRMYFHELEARDKISSRLQLPLAILLATISFYGVLTKGIELDSLAQKNGLYLTLLAISFISVSIASVFFVRALWGHSYEYIPTTDETEDYNDLLISKYKEFDNCDDLVSNYLESYLRKAYSKCATKNTHVNDNRSELLHNCNSFLILSAVLLLATYVFSNIYKIEKKPDKESIEVIIYNPQYFQKAPISSKGTKDDRKETPATTKATAN